MKAAPEPFLTAVASSREGLVVAVEGLFTWDGLADLCVHEGMPVVRGHALYRRAIHGGTATNDTSDSPKVAPLLRGGLLPQASVDPAEMRATRDLLRRRMPLRRNRSERFSHVPNTHSQDNLPEIGTTLASKANRGGVAARLANAAVQKHIEGDLALLPYDAERLRKLALSISHTAKKPEAHTLYLLHTVPGLGQRLSRVRLYDIHDMARFPRGPGFVSYGRLVTWAKKSAGKRVGTSGKKIGHAHLTWAFSEAAALVLPNHPTGQKSLVRWEKTPDKGQARTILAHQLARAVYDRLKRKTALDLAMFLRAEECSAGAPASSGLTVLFDGVGERQGGPLGPVSLRLTG
jgi:hypothetical protein